MRVVYCAGEQAGVVLDVLRRAGETDDVVLLDDDPARRGDHVAGVEVRSGDALSDHDPDRDRVLVAYGASRGVRLEIADRVAREGFGFFNAVDPETTVSEAAELGDGVTVNARSYVGPGATLGDHVLVDSAVVVSHGVALATGVTVGPDATFAGGVTVGRDAYVGAGATVRDHVAVGERAVVGAGAVVVDDVPAGETVAGVPAEPLE